MKTMFYNSKKFKQPFIGAALALSMGLMHVAHATEISNRSVDFQNTSYSEQDFAKALKKVQLDFHNTYSFMSQLEKDFSTVTAHKKELQVFPKQVKELLSVATNALLAKDAESVMQPYLEDHPHFVNKSQVLYLASEIRAVIYQLKVKHHGGSKRQKMRLARRIAVAMSHFDSFLKKLNNDKPGPKKFNRVEAVLQKLAHFDLDTIEIFAAFYVEAKMATHSVYEL
jgi:hypothetical protein